MIIALELVLWSFRFLAGACLFSFLNVVIYRLPRGESVIKGRSRCVHCGHELSPGELVPLVSFFLQRGKCRACGKSISLRYPCVEALGGAAFIICSVCYGTGAWGLLSLRGALIYAFLAVLTVAAMIDQDTRMIPDGFHVMILLLGILAVFLFPEILIWERFLGAVIISLPMLLLALAIPGAFGGGDIKLMAVCGFLLGWKANVFAMFMGLLTGGLWCMMMLAGKRIGRREQIAFGPFLAVGLAAAAFFGEQAANWYLSLLG